MPEAAEVSDVHYLMDLKERNVGAAAAHLGEIPSAVPAVARDLTT